VSGGGGATTAVSEQDHTVPIPRQPEPDGPEASTGATIGPAAEQPLGAAENQLADPAPEPAATADTENASVPA
jgi:hypothetical protein